MFNSMGTFFTEPLIRSSVVGFQANALVVKPFKLAVVVITTYHLPEERSPAIAVDWFIRMVSTNKSTVESNGSLLFLNILVGQLLILLAFRVRSWECVKTHVKICL